MMILHREAQGSESSDDITESERRYVIKTERLLKEEVDSTPALGLKMNKGQVYPN